MTQLGEGTQIGTIQDDVEDSHCLEVNYCYPGGLPVEGTYLATDSDGLQHRGSLNDLGGLRLNRLPAGQVDVELIPFEDSDTLETLRKNIKGVLGDILAEKRAETEPTEARGFWNGAVGLIEFAKDTLSTVTDIAEYLSPIERLNNLLDDSYKSYQSGNLTEEKWRQSLLDNMEQEELEDLSRLLGFDPSKINLTLITEAYEITVLIATDDATLDILRGFAKDYAGAQSNLDWAEFAGGGVFEIALAALLIAQAGSKIRHISRLRKLGGLLRRLGKVLKRRQLNKKVRVGVDNKTKVEAERLEGPKLTSGERPSLVPNNEKPVKGTPEGDKWRYERYEKNDGKLSYDEWYKKSRGGRSGGPNHKAIQDRLKDEGYKTEESFGNRAADAANDTEIHQIGGLNERGDPIARERDAIEDMLKSEEYNGEDIYFWDKNDPDTLPIKNPQNLPNWGKRSGN